MWQIGPCLFNNRKSLYSFNRHNNSLTWKNIIIFFKIFIKIIIPMKSRKSYPSSNKLYNPKDECIVFPISSAKRWYVTLSFITIKDSLFLLCNYVCTTKSEIIIIIMKFSYFCIVQRKPLVTCHRGLCRQIWQTSRTLFSTIVIIITTVYKPTYFYFPIV